MSSKTPNYTEAQETRMLDVYDPTADEKTREAQIVELADEFGKATKSIRAKLSSLKVYVKKEYKTKQGEKAETKSAIVTDIATLLGADEEQLSGLEKATKNTLNLIRSAFRVAADRKLKS
jgi:hypothetical protein